MWAELQPPQAQAATLTMARNMQRPSPLMVTMRSLSCWGSRARSAALQPQGISLVVFATGKLHLSYS